MVAFGDNQTAVGAGSGAGDGVLAVFFLGVVEDLGSKLDKVDKDSLNVDFHREDKDGAVEVRGLYNLIYSTIYYYE